MYMYIHVGTRTFTHSYNVSLHIHVYMYMYHIHGGQFSTSAEYPTPVMISSGVCGALGDRGDCRGCSDKDL